MQALLRHLPDPSRTPPGHADTRGHARTQADTSGHKRARPDTSDTIGHKRTQADTRRHNRTQADTSGHQRTQPDTRAIAGVRRQCGQPLRTNGWCRSDRVSPALHTLLTTRSLRHNPTNSASEKGVRLVPRPRCRCIITLNAAFDTIIDSIPIMMEITDIVTNQSTETSCTSLRFHHGNLALRLCYSLSQRWHSAEE